MNEKGLCVVVNMIDDSDTIGQQTDKKGVGSTSYIPDTGFWKNGWNGRRTWMQKQLPMHPSPWENTISGASERQNGALYSI
jgi:hypothetical protein